MLPSGRLIASTNKLSSLIKMTKWHEYAVHMAKRMNMVGAPIWWGALGLPPKNPALVLDMYLIKA